MNVANFTWEKYCSNVGFSLSEAWDMTTNRPTPEFEELGRCPASALSVRPRTEGEGVMLRHKESGDEFWLHALPDKMMGVGIIPAPKARPQTVQRAEAFSGDDGTWGVCSGAALIYDPQFARITAEAIADLENGENPPQNWHETKRRLLEVGLPA